MGMKRMVWATLGGLACCGSGQAQEPRPIYRCGNVYTNTVSPEQARDCKLVEGGNVTVVQDSRSHRPAAGKPAAPSASSTNGASRVDAAEQKSRDSEARLILQAELKRAEARQAELLREYNNGEPEKRGEESRNHQKYQDRVADLKASMARNESDLAGIRRELARVPASTASR